MASHQSLNWVPMHANRRLLQVLREEIGQTASATAIELYSSMETALARARMRASLFARPHSFSVHN